MSRNTAPAPNTGPGYWKNVSGAVHIIDFDYEKQQVTVFLHIVTFAAYSV